MEETPQQAAEIEQAPKSPVKKSANAKLTKEERSKIMSEAATRRWAKTRRSKPKTVKPVKKPALKTAAKNVRAAKSQKKVKAPREFSSALKTAENRLAKALLERAEAASRYAVLSAEIPSLQRLIIALKNPLGAVPDYGLPIGPSLEQIVGDQPLAYANPPRRTDIPAQSVPVIPVPQALHPANTQSRAGGGAIGGVELETDEDEDRHLNESPVSGGAWH